MNKKVKTGGRKKGTPNKRTKEIIDKLDDLGCDPIIGMAKIAMDETQDIALRGNMFKELAQYIAPKRKAIEHSSDVENPMQIVLKDYDFKK